MKTNHLIIAMLAVAILAFWIGRTSYKPIKKDIHVDVIVPDFDFTRVFKELDEIFPLVITIGDSAQEFDASTPIGELPPHEREFKDSLPFYVEDSLLWTNFKLTIGVLGEVLGYRFNVVPQYYQIPLVAPESPQPSAWRVNVFGAVYHDLTFDMIGIVMYKRVGVIGKLGTTRIWVDVPRINTEIRIGLVGRIL